MLINFDHLKTFSKALNIKMKGFRGNWNQNDSTADDYIKNRPFYSEGLKETIILDEVVNFNAGTNDVAGPMVYNGFIENLSIKPFTINQKYTVIWNGKTYDCKATNLDGIGVIGNAYLLGFMGSSSEFEDTGEPFFIGIETGFGVFLLSTQAGNVSVVVKGIEEKIHKLDKKFIDMPDGIVTEDDLSLVAKTGNYWDLEGLPQIDIELSQGSYNAVANDTVSRALDEKVGLVDIELPVYSYWKSICYGKDKYVAALGGLTSGGNAFAYSYDGTTWNTGSMPSIQYWNKVCYGNDVFIMTVGSSTSGNGASNIIAYSQDGINWTQTTLPATKVWKIACYGNGVFIVSAYGDTEYAYSVDGINWELKQTTFIEATGKFKPSAICYGGDRFVATTISGTNSKYYCAYSYNGIDWYQSTLPNDEIWQSICYGNGRFVAVAKDSGQIIISEDGITWDISPLMARYNLISVCYGNGAFVALSGSDNAGGSYNTVFYSTSGYGWIKYTLPIWSSWIDLCYGNNQFVAIAGGQYRSNAVICSPDGINWSNKMSHEIKDLAVNLKPVLHDYFDQAQSDWNQTDETALDYIKNKPFSENPIEILPETTFTMAFNNGYFDLRGMFTGVYSKGDVCTVIFDSIEYECTAYIEDSEMSYTALGGFDQSYPFFVYSHYVQVQDEQQHTIRIINRNVKKLDNKFLDINITDNIMDAEDDDVPTVKAVMDELNGFAGWVDSELSKIPALPEITSADNGKVLMVVNGKLQLVSLNLSVDANGVITVQ